MMRRSWQGAEFFSAPAVALLLGLTCPAAHAAGPLSASSPEKTAASNDLTAKTGAALAGIAAAPDDSLAPVPEISAAPDESGSGSPAGDAAPVSRAPNSLAPPSADALPAVNAAIKAALEALSGPGDRSRPLRREAGEDIISFYASREFAPLWWKDGNPAPEAAAAIDRLQHAADDGLNIKGFPEHLEDGSPGEVAEQDIALSEAVVAYARQASGSRVDPRTISRLIGELPQLPEPAAILARVAAAGAQAGEELRRFNPPHEAYEALRGKLLELRRARSDPGRRVAIPAGPVLRPGMRDRRVPLIRARLSLDGGGEESDGQDFVYDTKLAAAVAGFQKANGLPPSGKLTARTVAALSGIQSLRLEAEILANMERWRWMPRDLGDKRVEVNIPGFEAVVVNNGEVIERVRVVTGKEETPTPVFSGTIRYLIVNPAWNVPQSIIRKEMLPHLAADPGYFQRMGYEVSSRKGQLVVRQPPGERNALGRIKFVFPNDFSVYMHDTPMRHLFAASKRAFSHGCVRVDDPFRFAETLLGRESGWTEQRVKKMIGGKERYIYLPKPLPVHLEYFTAFVDGAGELQLREDVYGYSRRVKAALGLDG
jgi:murein L,D-transpeptidase YcbB/YkuD